MQLQVVPHTVDLVEHKLARFTSMHDIYYLDQVVDLNSNLGVTFVVICGHYRFHSSTKFPYH